jgi:hypothetical protein
MEEESHLQETSRLKLALECDQERHELRSFKKTSGSVAFRKVNRIHDPNQFETFFERGSATSETSSTDLKKKDKSRLAKVRHVIEKYFPQQIELVDQSDHNLGISCMSKRFSKSSVETSHREILVIRSPLSEGLFIKQREGNQE